MVKKSSSIRYVGKSEPFQRDAKQDQSTQCVSFANNTNAFLEGPSDYPDIRATAVKKSYLPLLKKIFPNTAFLTDDHVLVTNGSIEGLDIALKAIATPGLDFVSITYPSFSGFIFWANVNNIMYEIAPLVGRDYDRLTLDAVSPHSKGLLICNPNNPTSTALRREDIITILGSFEGFVLIDEAYSEFAPETSCLDLIDAYPNLMILKTLSKAWAAAGLRCGFILAQPSIIDQLEQFAFPYSVSTPNQQAVTQHLKGAPSIMATWPKIEAERELLSRWLPTSPYVKGLWPSRSNFLFVEIQNEHQLFKTFLREGIQVVDTSPQVDKTLRLTICQPEKNDFLLQAFGLDPQDVRKRYFNDLEEKGSALAGTAG